MPTLPIYQVDAFTRTLFAGNPAAVVPLDDWLADAVMLTIAAENNLAETAFFVAQGENRWGLRWFTPEIEVPLCGHATLATAFVLCECLGVKAERLTFATRESGELTVTRERDGRFVMRLPIRRPEPAGAFADLSDALGKAPSEVHFADVAGDASYLAVFDTEADVRALDPDLRAVAALDARNVVVTAKGGDVDFVSRMFAPAAGIDEDPVTGSAHCMLAPFWGERLGKSVLSARQVSKRGGDLWCEIDGETIVVSGHGVLYLEGRIHVPA
ncbi:PhzF family phenazine biosynthesis protein [Fulvimarina sp. 2208YS6-2-32]|uniref:PhzF family phenazine biosynthesis protein n=1 Tax=Fulvimarina uroteuthidis TaxID=3098149 RepID=A0ABU5HZ24_9HYPH|nr:PhzF family phenazine biosynthesis protein [Fulvimarina sp. 2208YS6-2-32]MDY8108206.1 PhzF family phenazine biosynthesis protein [Fulvimarina sp. 2208YS6-2-32]